MPCLKKCECGKEEKYFKFLNDEDIEAFKCEACPEEKSAKQSAKMDEEKPEVAEKIEESKEEQSAKKETAKERKARLKAEKAKAE